MQITQPTLEGGECIDGRYVVEDVIGRGGMSTVYRVRHTTLGSLHALKVMQGTDSVAHERLMREGRVQAGLDHPNVLRVTDVVRLDQSTGLILEYVRGCNLDEALRDGLLETWDERDQIGRAILRGVKAAHDQGWLHRDLKPSNVLLARRDDGWVVKVADFGLVRSTAGSATLTGTGSVVGTPAYMSPEQLFDAPMDARVDVFAIGAVLYELATGRRAFPGGTFEAAESIRFGRFEPPRAHAPDLPEPMERAILAALVAPRDRRAASCDVVLALWVGQRDAASDPTPTFEMESLVPHELPSATPRRSWPRLAGLSALALAVLGIGWWAAPVGPRGAAVAAAPVVQPAVIPMVGPPLAPPPSEPVESEPEPLSGAAAAVPRPVPAPRPVVRPPEPEIVPQPTPGRLVVTGTATSVQLVGSDGTAWSQGELPAGTYHLRATFGADGEHAFGDAVVAEGRTVNIDCDIRFTRCTVQSR